jgi:hypothetical protein
MMAFVSRGQRLHEENDMRRALQASWFVLLLFAIACGGGDETNARPAFDSAQATALATTALLDLRELPGSGWAMRPGSFDAPESSRVKSCDEIQAFDRDLFNGSAGRAARVFVRAVGGSPLVLQISQFVYVLDTEANARRHVSRYAGLTSNGGDLPCFDIVLEGATGQELNSIKAKSAGNTPPAGVSSTIDAEPATGAAIRYERHVWTHGNAIGWISMLGPRDAITADTVNAILASAAAALQDTAESKRAPSLSTPPVP